MTFVLNFFIRTCDYFFYQGKGKAWCDYFFFILSYVECDMYLKFQGCRAAWMVFMV